MNEKFKQDYVRFGNGNYDYSPLKAFVRGIKNHELSFIYWGRLWEHTKNNFVKKLCGWILFLYRKRYGLELNFRNVGGGLG